MLYHMNIEQPYEQISRLHSHFAAFRLQQYINLLKLYLYFVNIAIKRTLLFSSILLTRWESFSHQPNYNLCQRMMNRSASGFFADFCTHKRRSLRWFCKSSIFVQRILKWYICNEYSVGINFHGKFLSVFFYLNLWLSDSVLN